MDTSLIQTMAPLFVLNSSCKGACTYGKHWIVKLYQLYFYNEAKLRSADLESGALHIADSLNAAKGSILLSITKGIRVSLPTI